MDQISISVAVVVVIVSICLVTSMVTRFFSKKNKQNGDTALNPDERHDKESAAQKARDNGAIGYFRYQDDNQIVIQRDELQKKILEEYFIIKNYQTSDQSLAKKSKQFSIISVISLILGLILTIVGGVSLSGGAKGVCVGFGVLFLILSIIMFILFLHYKKKYASSIKIGPKKVMTDLEYEALVRKRIEEMPIVETLGLERLGLDAEKVKMIKPIILSDKVITDYSLKVYNPNTKTLHSSTQYIMLLYFTEDQLYVYKIQFDMCCNAQEEWTCEFFYKDICDVSTHVDKNTLKIGDYRFEYSTVSFRIVATNSEIGFSIDGMNQNISSIQAMRQKIREKKLQV